MKKVFILAIELLALLGCTSNKPVAENTNLNALKIEQCNRILNAPDFWRDALKDLSPQTNVDTQETCKPLETIICNGVEYRLYDVCGPWIIRYRIATEEDFL